MKYKYCTKVMVDKAVKQGREAVIKCASDKWWFFGTCGIARIKRLGAYPDLGQNCALCKEFMVDDYNSCGDCPLLIEQGEPCGHGRTIYNEVDELVDEFSCNPTATNFKKFQAKARKLARVIGRLK